ncbi:MAG TPA: S26 family signal peptidase [Rubrivivax sp.]|nr:S26 family signal peptidase [Rubrivivax sp.]
MPALPAGAGARGRPRRSAGGRWPLAPAPLDAVPIRPFAAHVVLGDNRDNASDSRFWGFIPERDIVGRVRWVWMNFSAFGRVGTEVRCKPKERPRSQRPRTPEPRPRTQRQWTWKSLQSRPWKQKTRNSWTSEPMRSQR